ncbi:acetyl-CoA C-acetyltransferase [Aurantimicrobium minutum]|uniref:acetyl-CoA C-acyltransferase n=1 Tax=Aurantimicrobium minutum TaxID=708131 RepID=UPI002473405A|nr:acetyl-CoA C-acyltransferase [Aurantimicrobium minutum]MDH6424274.1 acetyl-CoA C-acetyltransferase [Aurantimicrobium minutum]
MSVVIAGYARTPFVKMNGVLSAIPAVELGAHAIKAALVNAGVDAAKVDAVYGGQVLQGGCGQNPARQSAVAAGIPLGVPALTLNAVCLSGIEAITAGIRLIDSGEADVVVAVGQESMSLAPHAWVGSRVGKKYGPVTMVDTLEFDGLTDAFELRSMGASTEDYIAPLGLTRVEQDSLAARSHQNAAQSQKFLADEIAPFEISSRGKITVVSEDDGIRPETTVESLAGLRPAFNKEGTITAGNSSQLTDGAAAVVLVREEKARELGLTALARVVAHAFVSGPDYSLHAQPANAINAALGKVGKNASELVSVEINEAFAAVGVQSTKLLGISEEIVNKHGGAIALGHPIGASGARIVGHLARQLSGEASGSLGAAGICGGGGQGSAIVLEAL